MYAYFLDRLHNQLPFLLQVGIEVHKILSVNFALKLNSVRLFRGFPLAGVAALSFVGEALFRTLYRSIVLHEPFF